MKKNKLTKLQQYHMQIFFRFLKEESAYERFKLLYPTNDDVECYYRHIISRGQVIDYLANSRAFSASNNSTTFDYWCDIDNKWNIYMYNNKLYGTPSTCSKSNLLNCIDYITKEYKDINKETTNRAKEIIDKEKALKKAI